MILPLLYPPALPKLANIVLYVFQKSKHKSIYFVFTSIAKLIFHYHESERTTLIIDYCAFQRCLHGTCCTVFSVRTYYYIMQLCIK